MIDAPATLKAFEVGKTYTCRSICDSECIYAITIAKRTKSTITTTEGKLLRIIPGLGRLDNAEAVRPHGKYSMCAVIHA